MFIHYSVILTQTKKTAKKAGVALLGTYGRFKGAFLVKKEDSAMNIGLIVITICLSVFSTGVMGYIALATPIGPWIAPTLVLIGTFLVHLIGLRGKRYADGLALVTAGGSIGGIMATALSFSFPTFYFLDSSLFGWWMENPFYFVALVTGLCLAGGGLGLLIADLLEHNLLVKEDLPFPIGQLVYKMIAAQNQARKALELAAGACSPLFLRRSYGSLVC